MSLTSQQKSDLAAMLRTFSQGDGELNANDLLKYTNFNRDIEASFIAIGANGGEPTDVIYSADEAILALAGMISGADAHDVRDYVLDELGYEVEDVTIDDFCKFTGKCVDVSGGQGKGKPGREA